MSIRLYEVPLEFGLLEQALIESDGELTPELEKTLDEFLRSSKEKIEGGAMVMRGLEMEAEVCRTESKRLQERAAALDKNAGRLKKLILYALDGAFGGKLKTSLITLWGQTSAPTVNLDLEPGAELSCLPDNFVRIKYELAKDVVKDALKKGEAIPPEIIVTELPGTRFLRVK